MKTQAITHPAALAALLLLFLNDHVLRSNIPSILTGKAGDFAWLFFGSLAMAWIFSQVIPINRQKNSDRIARAGFAVISIAFVLGKTLPLCHAWIASGYRFITGIPLGLRLDPTDLVGLAALVPAWIVWKSAQHSLSRPRFAQCLALACFNLLTIANMAAPDVGIAGIEFRDHRILASSAYECFTSSNGGLTWESIPMEDCHGISSDNSMPSATSVVSDPIHPGYTWRFKPGETIEVSQDGGASWTVVYQLKPFSQAQAAYYLHTRLGNPDPHQGPFDILFDPDSGNVIFAMGHQGALVQTAASEWISVGIGQYKPAQVSSFDYVITFLMGELILGLAAGLLVLSILSILPVRRSFPVILIGLVVLVWLAIPIFSPPALSSGYSKSMAFLLVDAVAICSVLLAPFALFRLHALSTRWMWQAVLVAICAGILFTLPYILWAKNIIPEYWLATIIALILVGTSLMVGVRLHSRNTLPGDKG